MSRKRVVVTGMGVVTPLGNTVESAWKHIRSGVSGIKSTRRIDPEITGIHVAGEVNDFDPTEILSRKDIYRSDRIHQFAYHAALQSTQNSELHITDENRHRIGCIIGTSVGGIETMTSAVEGFAQGEAKAVRAFTIPNMLGDSISARVSTFLGLNGMTVNIGAACATGNSAIGIATDMIRLGRADVMVTGGVEASLLPWVAMGFKNMGAMSKGSDPLRASLPFHRERSGFVMAEGAGVLVIESLDHALARNAPILAEISGFGQAADAYHMTAPDPNGIGAIYAMREALQDASLQAESIDHINAHGTGTPLNDVIETRAIKNVFGDHAYRIPISSTKSMTGHMLSASSAVEGVWSILSLCDHIAPPTVGLDDPDPECDLNYVPMTSQSHEIHHVMNNAFGFGGLNAVIIFSRYQP